jgi:hypothetical protein
MSGRLVPHNHNSVCKETTLDSLPPEALYPHLSQHDLTLLSIASKDLNLFNNYAKENSNMQCRLHRFIAELKRSSHKLQILNAMISFIIKIGENYNLEIRFNKTEAEHQDQFIIRYINSSPEYDAADATTTHSKYRVNTIKGILYQSELSKLTNHLLKLESGESFDNSVLEKLLHTYMIDKFIIYTQYNETTGQYERDPDDEPDPEDEQEHEDVPALISGVLQQLKLHKPPKLTYSNIELLDITIWTPYNKTSDYINTTERFKVNIRQIANILLVQPKQGGKMVSKSKKHVNKTSREQIHILGRTRNITKEGRKRMITYQGKCISMTDARIIEKQLVKTKQCNHCK